MKEIILKSDTKYLEIKILNNLKPVFEVCVKVVLIESKILLSLVM